ncbi:glutaredoxin family protein [Marinomonas sp. 2405UD68-3]|uniref:glutaredoxin family protein n=1 Tax=Marinomonas sp. 2405UD68-3 TaxID=3391835 RepID=UPI0039C941B6
MPNTITLYGTLGCHLCDIAQQEILNSESNIRIKYVDIADNIALFEEFSEKIPVVEINKNYLYWPFNANKIDALIQSLKITPENTRRYLR